MPRTSDARQRMIAATAQLQREHGVAALALADVIAVSGAPRGSIYHHFPQGKAQLVTESTRFAGEFIGGVLDEALSQPDLGAALDHFVALWIGVLEQSAFSAGCPVAAAAVDTEDGSGARVEADAAFRRWESAIAARVVAAGAEPEDAERFATFTVSAVEGALLLCRARRDAAPLRRVAAEIGLAARRFGG